MNKVEKKRQKEQYVVEEMIRLYCRKKRGACIRRNVSGMSEISGLCKTAEPEMSLHGTENILRKLQSTLLQAGNAGKDPRRYAVFGAEDAAVSSDFSYLAFDLQHEREAKSKSIKERYL